MQDLRKYGIPTDAIRSLSLTDKEIEAIGRGLPSLVNADIASCVTTSEYILPTGIIANGGSVSDVDNLLIEKNLAVTFNEKCLTVFENESGKENAYVLLDFGRELHGSLRLIANSTSPKEIKLRLVFGESVSEALSTVGWMNATNDHSPRDITVSVSNMSDLEFAETGFRFVKIELIDKDAKLFLKSAVAVSKMQKLCEVGYIKTNDERLNTILDTALHTCRLNLQHGLIWDGIKRDRLVWSGDLNIEILTSLYSFGNIPNIKNSLTLLRESTPIPAWINNIPSYSAWWVINLCDYYRLSGDKVYTILNLDYAIGIMKMIDTCIEDDGNIDFNRVYEGRIGMPYYLDWPTLGTPDAKVGVAMLILCAAEKLLGTGLVFGETVEILASVSKKLSSYLTKPVQFKQTRAIQALMRAADKSDKEALEKNGAHGFSTFMSYFILTSLKRSGSERTLELTKEYYGAMLDYGATSFFEDFSLDWITENTARIDEIPKVGQNDLHRDHGAYCYKNLRHSLCHGWSAGPVPYFIENILGLKVIGAGFEKISVHPSPEHLTDIEALIKTPKGDLLLEYRNSELKISAPDGIEIIG